MFRNYLKTAFRVIKRNKVYSFITIFSLSVGFVSCLLIGFYIQDELSYDRYHRNAGRICRVYEELVLQGQKRRMAVTPAPFGPAMKEEIPQVEEAVRFLPGEFGGNEVLVRQSNKSFYEDKWFFADEGVFRIFSFDLIKGNPETVLRDPFSVVLSQSKAREIFGPRNPIGRTLTLENKSFSKDFMVKGVFSDMPGNSHFTFDFLASFASVKKVFGKNLDNWFNHMCYTYLLLPKDAYAREVESQFPALIKKHAGKDGASILKPKLQALTSIRLHSNLENEIEPNSDASYILIFFTAALFILCIAAVNFINLTTARSSIRAGEVGMRKVVGARRNQLVFQFMGESILLAGASLFLALFLAAMLLPWFNTVAGKCLELDTLNFGWMLIVFLVMSLAVGILSGIYPALYLSRCIPARVLKGGPLRNSRSGAFRKGLVVFQFAVSIALIVLALGVRDQLQYIRAKKLGFHKDNVAVLPFRDSFIKRQYSALKNEMLRGNQVESVSASSGLPGRITHHWLVEPEGWQQGDERPVVWVMMVDHDFISTMGMEIVEGRDFSREISSDQDQAVLINESAQSLLGWEKPLGKRIKTENMTGRVTGVVRDFHFQSFRKSIKPLIIYIYPRHFSYLLVRLRGENIQEGMGFIRRTWKNIASARHFECFFLDRDFDRFYRAEQRAGKIFGGFAFLAVVVALLGLYGLGAFTAEQRTKEVGIRKVLGASVPGLMRLLTSEFTRLVLLANLAAWPFAYYFIRNWLANFAYRTQTSVWLFISAGALALGLSSLAVGFQAYRAAASDPAKVLRCE